MRTRSSSNLIVESSTIPKRRNRRRSKQIVEPELRTIVETPVATMADTRTMSELLQAPTEGYGDAIVIPVILAKTFELKVGLLQLVTSSQFHGFERDDPHAHIHSLNAATGGNLLNRTPRDALTIIKNKSKVRTSRNKSIVSKVSTTTSSSLSPDVTALTEIVKELVLMNKANQQASVKAVEETCVTCGGPHPYYECLATDSNTFNAYAAIGTYNQGDNGYRPQGDPNYRASNQMGPPGFSPPNVQNNQNYNRNEATLRAMQTQMTNMKTELRNEFKSSFDTRTNKIENQNNQIMNMLTNLTMQKKNLSGLGSLPSNTVANPIGDVKPITTRSGVSYDGPKIPPTPSPLPKEVECETETTKDKVQNTSSKITAHVQPPVVQYLVLDPEVAPKTNLKPSIPYPSRLNDQNLYEKANNQMLKFLQIFHRLHFDISFPDALLHMPKFASTFKSLLSNKEKLFELASTPLNENCSAVLLKKLPEKLRDPVDYNVGPRVPLILGRPFLRTARALIDVHGEELTLRVNDEAITFKVGHTSRYSRGDFILEEIKTCLSSDSIPPGIDDADFDLEGDIRLLEKLLNDDPSSHLPPKELNFEELKMIKSSIEDPPELKLKDLPSHLEYAFLEGTDKLPIIISKELKDEEKAALLKVFKSHKRAITWKISNINGIDPHFCTHKILMEDDFKSSVVENFPALYQCVESVRNRNENSSIDAPNPNSFNDPPNVFTHPPQPQYESYSCELCGNDAHYGYDCPPRVPLDGYYDSEGDIIYLESFKDTILNLPPEVFLDRDPRSLEDEPDKDDLKNIVKDCPDFEDSRARGFVHRSLNLQSFACLYMESDILDLC
ncbi:hypothetical protein Tco_1186033 [Tanacetum coccineum]